MDKDKDTVFKYKDNYQHPLKIQCVDDEGIWSLLIL